MKMERNTKRKKNRHVYSRDDSLFITVLISLAFVLLILIAASLGGCAAAPSRWEALAVAGSPYAAVYRNGIPQTPGRYQVMLDIGGHARFFEHGQIAGEGSWRMVEPFKAKSVKLEVSPGTRVTVTGQ